MSLVLLIKLTFIPYITMHLVGSQEQVVDMLHILEPSLKGTHLAIVVTPKS